MKTMRKPIGIFLGMALLAAAGCGGSSSSSPQVQPPDSLDPGGTGFNLPQVVDDQGATVEVNFSSAVAVNDNNQIVGFAEIAPGDPFKAALWAVSSAGEVTVTPTELAPLVGGSFSAAFALDQGGNVVGQAQDGSQLVAVIWSAGSSTPVELPALAASGNSAARGISAALPTLVVGDAQGNGADTRAVLWTANAQGAFGNPIVLPVTAFATAEGPSIYSSASGVARVGTEIWVVGEVEDGDGEVRAVLWRSSNGTTFTATDLGAAGDVGSAAYAVSGSGQIAGEAETAAGTFVPVSWAADGTGGFARTELAASGSAVAINQNNRIAGSTGSSARATVWTGAVPATLFDTVSQAYGLNNAAQPLVVGTVGGQGFVKRVN